MVVKFGLLTNFCKLALYQAQLIRKTKSYETYKKPICMGFPCIIFNVIISKHTSRSE